MRCTLLLLLCAPGSSFGDRVVLQLEEFPYDVVDLLDLLQSIFNLVTQAFALLPELFQLGTQVRLLFYAHRNSYVMNRRTS